MQTAPEHWEDVIAGDHIKEVKAVIGGATYTSEHISICQIQRQAFETFGIGHAPSATLTLGIYTADAIARAAEIKAYVRLRNANYTTDWVEKGTYYIDTRIRDSGYVEITANDRMLMAEEDYFSTGVISGTWPKSESAVMSEISTRMGVALDSRVTYSTTRMVPAPINMTMREVLCSIAAANGGNFIITDANKLYLLPITTLPSFDYLVDGIGNYVADEYGNRIILLHSNVMQSGGKTLEQLADMVTVSKVMLNVDDKTGYTSGTDTGFAIEATCVYATQSICNSALQALNGVQYNPVSVSGTQVDPRIELGDAVMCEGEIFRSYSIGIDLSDGFADLASPIDGEVDHEYPYQDKTANQIKREIAKTKAEIKITTDSIQSEVSGKLDSDDAQTLIDQRIDGISLSATSGTNSSTLTIAANGVTIDSQVITMGYVVADQVSANNITGNITSGQISLYGDMTVFSDSSLYYAGGYLGYTQSTKDGSGGIHMASSNSEVRCTPYGAAMEGSGGGKVVATGDVNVTAGYGCAVYLKPNGGAATYQASDTEFFSYRQNNLGMSYYPWNAVYAATGTIQTSDKNKKKNISYKMSKYDKLFDLLKPSFFKFRNGSSDRFHTGLIAQDVEKALEESGLTSQDFAGFIKSPRKKKGFDYALRYDEFIALLIDQVQKVKKQVEELKKRVEELEDKHGE